MRNFGHQRPVRDKAGEVIALKDSPVCALTHDTIGHEFGSDWKRKLVVTLANGDLVEFRPQGTQRAVSGTAKDMYRYLLRCQANRLTLEKARAKKERKSERLAAQRQKRAEDKLFGRDK